MTVKFQVPVAVKKLKPTAQDKELIILVGEMQIFKSIGEHKNVLKLIGCSTGLGPLYVVLELCRHGNLRYSQIILLMFKRNKNIAEASYKVIDESMKNLFIITVMIIASHP